MREEKLGRRIGLMIIVDDGDESIEGKRKEKRTHQNPIRDKIFLMFNISISSCGSLASNFPFCNEMHVVGKWGRYV